MGSPGAGRRVSGALTFDAGALIAIERRSRRMQALREEIDRRDWQVAVPAGAVAQAWRGGPRQARIAALLADQRTEVVALDDPVARAAGLLCGRPGHADVSMCRLPCARGSGICMSSPPTRRICGSPGRRLSVGTAIWRTGNRFTQPGMESLQVSGHSDGWGWARCKTVGSAYVGPNPTPATPCEDAPAGCEFSRWRVFFSVPACVILSRRRRDVALSTDGHGRAELGGVFRLDARGALMARAAVREGVTLAGLPGPYRGVTGWRRPAMSRWTRRRAS